MTAPVLAFNTANGRYYSHPSRRSSVPSITNIIGKKAKPLYGAGLKAAARYAAEHRATLATLDEEQAFTLIKDPPKKDDSPSAIGDLVHLWVEEFIRSGGKGPPEEDLTAAPQTARWMYERFVKFCERYQPTFTATEFTVWSHKHGYAGTADFSMKVGGAHVLADAKTGFRVYPEAGMQLAALANADVVLSEDGTESPVPSYDRFAVLHLRPRSFTLHPVENIDAAFACFLNLKAVFDWDVEHAERTIGFGMQVKS